jgi:hypothetical protein
MACFRAAKTRREHEPRNRAGPSLWFASAKQGSDAQRSVNEELLWYGTVLRELPPIYLISKTRGKMCRGHKKVWFEKSPCDYLRELFVTRLSAEVFVRRDGACAPDA